MIARPDTPLVRALHPSPNHEPRKGRRRADLLLLHYTGMRSAAGAIDWLSRPESKVSSHYVIDEDGLVTQMVRESRRAWHAGVSCWAGESDINSASIGIEIQNPGHALGYPEFPEAQMAALVALCADIIARNPIPPERVLAHSDVAPGRKIDPGERFDWRRLWEAGVGHWVPAAPVDPLDRGLGTGESGAPVERVLSLMADYGYPVKPARTLDATAAIVVRAFQIHFRPERADGRIDESTRDTLERLVAALHAKRAAV